MLFSSNLRIYRKKANLTQIELANILHVAQSTVGNWESGIREPSFEIITKISEILHTTPSHLMGWDKAPTPDVKKDNSEIASLIIRLRTDKLFLEAVKKIDELDSKRMQSLLAFLS